MKLRPNVQAEVDRLVAKALGQSEPGPTTTSVSIHVFDDDRTPRIPAIGLHPGAIEGTTPHHNIRLDRWAIPR